MVFFIFNEKLCRGIIKHRNGREFIVKVLEGIDGWKPSIYEIKHYNLDPAGEYLYINAGMIINYSGGTLNIE